MDRREVDVAVVGAGPAGLAVARELARSGDLRVLVLEREAEAGGVPRHCHHTGFGVSDYHRLLRGPEYSRRLVNDARDAGATILTKTTVIDWRDSELVAVSPDGHVGVAARAVVLATGVRERPRSARWIAGDRDGRVMTTGQLQRMVDRGFFTPAPRALVVGADPVGLSALRTLRGAGARELTLVSERERGDLLPLVPRLALGWGRGRLRESSRILGVWRDGEHLRVEGEQRGMTWSQVVDTVVVSGDWIPDVEVARLGGLRLSDTTRGPLVDSEGETSRSGVFAVGNVVHPAQRADVCALEGARLAEGLRTYLAGREGSTPTVRLEEGEGCAWVTPAATSSTSVELTLWPRERRVGAWLSLEGSTEDGRLLEVRRHFVGVLIPGIARRTRVTLPPGEVVCISLRS